jgi:hypothetical protein
MKSGEGLSGWITWQSSVRRMAGICRLMKEGGPREVVLQWRGWEQVQKYHSRLFGLDETRIQIRELASTTRGPSLTYKKRHQQSAE